MQTYAIENYGIIGNMRSAALLSQTGAIDFLCFPEFDSPTVFAALLDGEKGGTFRIDPQIENIRTKQLYLPDTNLLLTRFLSDAGVAEITDFMPVSDTDGHQAYAHQVIRMLRVIRGEVRFRLLCAPRFNYAQATHQACKEGEAICFRPQGCDVAAMALYGTVPLEAKGNDGVAEFTLRAGECASFAFGSLTEEEKTDRNLLDAKVIQQQFEATTKFWRDWMQQSQYQGRWREVVNRSALALKLLTSRKHGSIIAAATCGLPEEPGGSRNWDYRYTWLRDSSFTLYAFMRLGFTGEAQAFTHWLRDRLTSRLEQDWPALEEAGPLEVIYSLDGTPVPDEVTLTHMAGFQASQPVRIGNGAATQLQLDIYGELMDAVYLSNKYASGISNDGWARLRQVLSWLGRNWEREDEGIWEVRSGRQHFLHSRLMCWVAFDRAIRLAQKRSLVAPLSEWLAIRDAIHEDIFENFWSNKLQSFVQAKNSEIVDAATLLMPLLRFISPTDPRWVATMSAIEANLTEDALVYRYSTGSDGLDGTEGAFIACSFWRIECLARQGEVDRARLLFDKMLGYANHLGLYAEELGPSGEQLGNYPQALSHLALISAATYLDRKLSKHSKDTWE